MKKDAKEILHYDIMPNIGLGEIHFGMRKDEVLEKYNIEEYISSGECIISGNKMTYYKLFNESIVLGFNSNLILINITVRNQFKGRYLNQITVGTPFLELYKLKKDTLRYDDEMFFPEGLYDFCVELDMDGYIEKFGRITETSIYSAIANFDTSEEAKELLNNIKIEQISIQKDI